MCESFDNKVLNVKQFLVDKTSVVLLQLPAAISFGGLGELCSDLQWLRGARGSLIYREPSHFQELKQLGCFCKVTYFLESLCIFHSIAAYHS